VKVHLQAFLALALQLSGQFHAPADLLPWNTDTPGRGGWVGPGVNLDVVTKRKIPAPAKNRTVVVQPIASHYTG